MISMRTQVTEATVANFVQKAFDIISNDEFAKIIQWSPSGKQFTIKDIDQFEEAILPKFFRHRNINSFIRQLNMYGFHKSRREPTKNIFSHPFFQRGRAELLAMVRRKIRLDDQETPRKPTEPEYSTEKLPLEDKPTAHKEEPQQQPTVSLTSLALLPSLPCLERELHAPVKGLISRSFIMDINPELCLKLRENPGLTYEDNDDDDKLSIADEIVRERQRFNNRVQGFSIVKTSNFLDEFQF